MRPFGKPVWGAALALLAAGGGEAGAAWNNVFQVCCFNCRKNTPVVAARPVVVAASPAADPCPQPCPQQQCTTRYLQRSYYQPVTTYRQETFYEPVTTYRTSYYYEPVTSYRYSCYYDPCTCSYQQVATPTCSYRLRSQCCPTTSYLQRCAMKPVTSWQLAYYYEPQTTCCTTTTGAPVFPGGVAPPPGSVGLPGGAPPAGAVPVVPGAIPGAIPGAPGVSDQNLPGPPPGVQDGVTNQSLKRDYNPPAPGLRMPRVPEGASYRPQQPRSAEPPVAPPSVRLDASRIAAAPPLLNLQGEVVGLDRRPQIGATVLFVNADRPSSRQTATSDASGHFRATLAPGHWLVYLSGRPELQTTVDVRGSEAQAPIRLVSR